MIKEVESINEIASKHRNAFIRRDIQEAINRGIGLFEFVGNEYDNKKHLASSAREVARRMEREALRPKVQEMATKHGWKYARMPYKPIGYIRVTQRKIADELRVYCMIDDEALDRAVKEIEIDEINRRQKNDEVK